MFEKVCRYIRENSMIHKNMHIIAGVSGGADSMCMLVILSEIAPEYAMKLHVVHVNHGIRGKDAAADEEFVRNYCDKNNIDFKAFHIDVPALSEKLGLSEEETGRNERYRIFRSRMDDIKKGASPECECRIAVAHNMNDEAETILFREFRGTGINGTAGMKPVDADVIRPLLCVKRKEIEEYLSIKEICYCTDKTNFSGDYSRNIIRNDILRVASEKVNSKSVEHICELGNEAQVLISFFNGYVDKEFARIFSEENCYDKCYRALTSELAKLDRAVLFGVIRKALILTSGKMRDIERIHVESIVGILYSGGCQMLNLPYDVVAVRSYDVLKLFKASDKNRDYFMQPEFGRQPYYVLDEAHPDGLFTFGLPVMADDFAGQSFKLENGKIECLKFDEGNKESLNVSNGRRLNVYISSNKKSSINLKNNYTKCFDYGKIIRNIQDDNSLHEGSVPHGLCLRTAQPGDYLAVYRNGMRKTLKKLLTDCKVPALYRKRLLLLCSGNLVIWVIGLRGSEVFSVDDDTVNVLNFELIN
jgi:tRNA(Ile)-lysidine synthase